MRTKKVPLLFVGILFFGLLAPSVFATPEEDFANAEKSFNEEDMKEAARYLKLSADQNYFPAQVRLGEFMYGSDDYEEAFGWFLTAAYQGDAAGQYNLGVMYGGGYGIEKSPEKAFYWTKKSAEQNYLIAVQVLAKSYKNTVDANGVTLATQNVLGITPNQEQADFWAAKLPELEKIEAGKQKKARIAQAKKDAAAAEKIKQEKSKLLCGLKC